MESKEETYPIYRFTARWSEISKDITYEEYQNYYERKVYREVD